VPLLSSSFNQPRWADTGCKGETVNLVIRGLKDPEELLIKDNGSAVEISHFSYFDRDEGSTLHFDVSLDRSEYQRALGQLRTIGEAEASCHKNRKVKFTRQKDGNLTVTMYANGIPKLTITDLTFDLVP
jgi:hypothetical protein